MPGQLILGLLNIRSSFRQNLGIRAVDGAADTVQWWLQDGQAWRIRTFAADDEIHVDWMGDTPSAELIRNTQENYGEFLHEIKVIDIPDVHNESLTARVLRKAGLAPNMVVMPTGFAYWSPSAAA